MVSPDTRVDEISAERKMKPRNIFLYIMLSFIIWHVLMPANVFALSIGEKAPLFSLKDISGREWSLKDLKGKVVFINFWGSWCHPCKKELPALNELQKKNKDVVVLAVNIDKSSATVDTFLKKHPLDQLTILLDSESKVISSFGARAMPTSFILDGYGKVRFVHYGFNEKNDPMLWENELREILNGGQG